MKPVYIGKETDNIENAGILDFPDYSIYENEDRLRKKLLKISWKEARKIGLNEETLRQIKKRCKEKPLRLYRKTIKIISFSESN